MVSSALKVTIILLSKRSRIAESNPIAINKNVLLSKALLGKPKETHGSFFFGKLSKEKIIFQHFADTILQSSQRRLSINSKYANSSSYLILYVSMKKILFFYIEALTTTRTDKSLNKLLFASF